ncbi:MAG: Uma2 family endonuclease [Spirochaetaceae bacterium]|nr:Uma2 family endonuclease [Spirochaetaceae bacterium]
MGEPAIKDDRKFTYKDYLTWPEDERWELIGGVAHNMLSAPNRRHQAISMLLSRRIGNFLEGKPCKVYAAPFDVLLPELGEEDDGDVSNVVEPDILVYCDRSRLKQFGARGAPDLVVEILSPSTHVKDLREKYDLYERMGVREYWVVDPAGESIDRFVRGDAGRFGKGELREPLFKKEPIRSTVLEGLVFDPQEIFAAE